MHDHELKKLLEETHPVRPGQEERAWNVLKERLASRRRRTWLYLPTWRGATVAFTILAALTILGNLIPTLRPYAPRLVSADSQVPGIYATAFYSKSAHAQVVWLTGMDPASDQPTYLDPTSAIPQKQASKTSRPADDPNSL
jgi:anti-sigma-K factor RskA